MEACPYCGAEQPNETAACWKCGYAFSGDPADAADPDSIEKRKSDDDGGPQIECPFCEALVAPNALRCNRCGQVLHEVEQPFEWHKVVYPVVGVVLLCAVAAWVYWFATTRPDPPDRGRSTPINQSYQQLERLYLRDFDAAEIKREEVWNDEHANKYVNWAGEIAAVDEATGIVRVNHTSSGLAEDAKVELHLKHAADVQRLGLKRGKWFEYSARLVRYEPGEQGKLVLDLALPTAE